MNIGVNGNPTTSIILGPSGRYTLPSVESIDYLTLGNALYANVHCQRKEYIYCIEEDDLNVKAKYY
jgi:hypothetical protein